MEKGLQAPLELQLHLSRLPVGTVHVRNTKPGKLLGFITAAFRNTSSQMVRKDILNGISPNIPRRSSARTHFANANLRSSGNMTKKISSPLPSFAKLIGTEARSPEGPGLPQRPVGTGTRTAGLQQRPTPERSQSHLLWDTAAKGKHQHIPIVPFVIQTYK